MSVDSALTSFFGTILAGESKTYNDHNWYVGSTLKGYVEGRNANPYPLLKKPLSEYTVGEIMNFQSRPRDASGQLWATGRYQIIPQTLKGLLSSAGVSTNDKYNKKTQDKLGLQLLKNRQGIEAYIYGKVPNTTDSLNKAITQTAMVWSSVGVPQDMRGMYGNIKKGQSYYQGGGDKAAVSPDSVGRALQGLRSALTGVEYVGETIKKNKGIAIGAVLLLILGILLFIYRKKVAEFITKL